MVGLPAVMVIGRIVVGIMFAWKEELKLTHNEDKGQLK